MAEKRCGLGFSCAAMQQQPSLQVEDCPNLETCGIAQRLEPDAEFELVWYGNERFGVTRREAAAMMLMRRGCPQPVESFGVGEAIAELSEQLRRLEDELAQYEGTYIAPAGVEAVSYSVKRPGRMVETPDGTMRTVNEYWYNKLMSQQAIFAPAEESRPVKVIHLSKDDDPRNQEGRRGVERRNQLNQIATQMRIAETAIAQARALAAPPSESQ